MKNYLLKMILPIALFVSLAEVSQASLQCNPLLAPTPLNSQEMIPLILDGQLDTVRPISQIQRLKTSFALRQLDLFLLKPRFKGIDQIANALEYLYRHELSSSIEVFLSSLKDQNPQIFSALKYDILNFAIRYDSPKSFREVIPLMTKMDLAFSGEYYNKKYGYSFFSDFVNLIATHSALGSERLADHTNSVKSYLIPLSSTVSKLSKSDLEGLRKIIGFWETARPFSQIQTLD